MACAVRRSIPLLEVDRWRHTVFRPPWTDRNDHPCRGAIACAGDDSPCKRSQAATQPYAISNVVGNSPETHWHAVHPILQNDDTTIIF